MTCKHEESYWDDDTLICPDCDEIVGFTCPSCLGDGFVQEDEYEGDWVNCTDDLITCPECHGKGVVKELTWQ